MSHPQMHDAWTARAPRCCCATKCSRGHDNIANTTFHLLQRQQSSDVHAVPFWCAWALRPEIGTLNMACVIASYQDKEKKCMQRAILSHSNQPRGSPLISLAALQEPFGGKRNRGIDGIQYKILVCHMWAMDPCQYRLRFAIRISCIFASPSCFLT